MKTRGLWFWLLVACALSLQAENIVVNPGFETGDFTGWTVTLFNPSDATLTVESNAPHSGTHYARFGNIFGYDSLLQVLPTTAGVPYTLSFFLKEDGGTPLSADFQVYFDGNLVVDVPGETFDYTQFVVPSLVASSNSTELEFRGYNVPGFTRLDDVSVGGAVPEPAAWVLAGGGVLLVAALRKRRAAV